MADTGQKSGDEPSNPLRPLEKLHEPSNVSSIDSTVHPQKDQFLEDSAVTKAEKYERHGPLEDVKEIQAKRRRIDGYVAGDEQRPTKSERKKGVAPIKAELADL